MQRAQVDEIICGVEIIARRIVRVLLRSWVAPLDGGSVGVDRPFFGLYLPVAPGQSPSRAPQPDRARRSLLPGGMVELDTGNARYLIRFTQTIERQAGWAWALFSAVRKLSGCTRGCRLWN